MRLELSLIRLLAILLPGRSRQLVEQAAGEVARQCRTSLWRQVCRQTANMSIAEVRGYVRAQAAGYVETEVDQAICRHHLKLSLHSRVADAAVDRLVGMIARDVLGGEPPVTRTMAA